MTRISRRSFTRSAAVVGVAAAGGFNIGGVHAADFKLRYANNLPASHPMNVRATEAAGDFTGRLVLMEEWKSLPFGAVWDEYCLRANVPIGVAWLEEVRSYERAVLSKRA